jgi:hypothetical protein
MNKLNWPTALVITAIIFVGAFVYNKPIDAGASSAGVIEGTSKGGTMWQLAPNGTAIRACYRLTAGGGRWAVNCTAWAN